MEQFFSFMSKNALKMWRVGMFANYADLHYRILSDALVMKAIIIFSDILQIHESITTMSKQAYLPFYTMYDQKYR